MLARALTLSLVLLFSLALLKTERDLRKHEVVVLFAAADLLEKSILVLNLLFIDDSPTPGCYSHRLA